MYYDDDEITMQESIRQAHLGTFLHHVMQRAQFGLAMCPAYVIIGMNEARKAIQRINEFPGIPGIEYTADHEIALERIRVELHKKLNEERSKLQFLSEQQRELAERLAAQTQAELQLVVDMLDKAGTPEFDLLSLYPEQE